MPQPALPHPFPGAILHIVGKTNNILFSYASGGLIPLSANTITMIHSASKIIGAITFMQLVDRGFVSLDDTSIISELLPELVAKKTPILVERKGEITPRMLMNHTYGGGHTYFNEQLMTFLAKGWEKKNEVADPYKTSLESPLLWQPENIFGPLGLKRTGYEETYGGDATSRSENKGVFWPRSFKQPDGSFPAIDPPILEKVERETAFPEGTYHNYPLGTGPASTATHLRNDSRTVLTTVPRMCYEADLQAAHMDRDGSFGFGCGVQVRDRVLRDGGGNLFPWTDGVWTEFVAGIEGRVYGALKG
ncbi:hypothetical protein K469DRAFT_725199 [Zopfia rhizophila CBS 207.26]|uniref:Beta-lactamase-related domain-containing protein n=1 Tax=Zopfia rhizophila CBS 207.26 TaxID=1314779 RepID=A0A6A6E9K4_9PEZI|nr:hypothetical protein K469DRAFT_725199 [Zopfia rhizophila CBS 207.26]